MGGVSGPEGLPVYVNSDGELVWVDTTGTTQIISTGGTTAASTYKSYAFDPRTTAGSPYYVGGYYQSAAASSALTQASATATFGTANLSYAAHAFLVASAAGSASGGSGAVEIEVSGTSITDAGVRTTSDTEVIVSDITGMSTDAYYETSKKWIGQVTYTLQNATGSTQTTFSATFNRGFAKYEDFGNRDFVVTDFEVVGIGSAADATPNFILYHHNSSGWTYHATTFVPGGTQICNMNTDHNTEIQLAGGPDYFAYKRANLNTPVTGSSLEGVIVRIDVGGNNSMDAMTAHMVIRLS
jgi:hypothetical protein